MTILAVHIAMLAAALGFLPETASAAPGRHSQAGHGLHASQANAQETSSSRTIGLQRVASGPSLNAPLALAPNGEPWPVGRIITPKGAICTGVLVGEHAVLTAAHCLTTRAGDNYFPAAVIHFALLLADGTQLYAQGVERHGDDTYPLPASTDHAALSRDWAVLLIDEPLGRRVSPAPLLTGADWDRGAGWGLTVIAFGRARALRPTIAADACRLLSREDPLVWHDCVVEPGSSGSVLLGVRGSEMRALAVNVAVRRGTRARTTATLLPTQAQSLAERIPKIEEPWQSPFDRSR